MHIRRATMSDTDAIYQLIKHYALEGKLLSRTYASIYENLQNFYVADEGGAVAGVASLHILDKDLAEIRSLAVDPDHTGKGIGKELVKQIIYETNRLEIENLIALTYQIEFFTKLGFDIVDKQSLPQKMWKDCINCPKLPSCDETAMLKKVWQTELAKQ
ncbi:MAG: N-acetyltransferase [Bacillaceae bacterium]|jgi:amino-acid N-acetyltransferase|uniref:Acetyltransferase n=2 Tax=Aeribacillus TaxID=1055323 RepID=A0A165YXB7_9BACI|nr:MULTISPECIES: N-acetyltransferase [Aeribacillus]REJ16359.1 MAG: N-acetyltransferase [Bacillaceae bacterium]KZM54514.1 acetyltransferase [Aeribacillus pallidus]KZN97551.1 acetyltransferase [Aeribacillus pallidus]MDR9792363.1 N-acetyltransferase [Aeribacillus pallidus]MDR9798060.1 N-acetyltransferase [Aeribacillus pallidus]